MQMHMQVHACAHMQVHVYARMQMQMRADVCICMHMCEAF